MSDRLYQNIIDIARIIEDKEKEIKQYEEELLDKPVFAIQGFDWKPVDQHSDLEKREHEHNLAALNEAISQRSNLLSQYYKDAIPESTSEEAEPQGPGEPLSDVAPEYTEEDFLAPYRAQLGDQYNDEDIMNMLQAWQPEIYNQIKNNQKEQLATQETPESAKFQLPDWDYRAVLGPTLGFVPGGGPISQLGKTWRNSMINAWANERPAFWKRYVGTPFTSQEDNIIELKSLIKENAALEGTSISDEQIDDYVNSIVQQLPGAIEMDKALAAEYSRRGRINAKKVLEEDSDLSSYMQYHGAQGENMWRDNTGKLYLHKFLIKAIGEPIPSIAESQALSGTIGKLSKLSGLSRAPQLILQVLGLYGYGTLAEGASSQAQSLEFLLSEQEYSNEKFELALDDFRKELKAIKHTDENGEEIKPTFSQIEANVKKYIEDNFENRNGKIIRLPHTVQEALEMSHFTDMINGLGGGAIENIDRMFFWMKAPINGPLRKAKTLEYLTDKTSELVRRTPFLRYWQDLRKVPVGASRWNIYANKGIDIITGKGAFNFAEGLEEIAMSNFSAMNEIHGPLGFRELNKYHKGASWDELWTFKEHIVTPGLGGIGGMKVINSIRNVGDAYLNATGLKNKLNKISIENQFKKNGEDGHIVVQEGPAVFRLYRRTSFIDAKTGELTYEQGPASSVDYKGNKIETLHSNFEDARQASNLINYFEKAEGEKRIAALNKHLYNADAKILVDEAAKEFKDAPAYEVIINGENGKTIRNVGKFKTRAKANKKIGEINRSIDKINKIINKTKDLKDIERIANEINENADRVDKVQNADKGGYTKEEKRVVMKGFMLASKKTDGTKVKLTEKQEAIFDKLQENEVFTNPELIAEIVNDVNNRDIFDDELLSRQDFVDNFNSEFSDMQDLIDINELLKDENYIDEVAEEEVEQQRIQVTDKIKKDLQEFIPEEGYDTAEEGRFEEQEEKIIDTKKVKTSIPGVSDTKKKAPPKIDKAYEETLSDWLSKNPGKTEKDFLDTTQVEYANLTSGVKSEEKKLETYYNKLISRIKRLSNEGLSWNEIISKDNGKIGKELYQINRRIQAAEKTGRITDFGKAQKDMLFNFINKVKAKKKAPKVKATPDFKVGFPTLDPGEVVVYNKKEYIVRKVNEAGKVQMIDRETGKNFPGTPNADTILKGHAVDQLETAMWNGYEYAADGDLIYSLASGKLITAKATKDLILGEFAKADGDLSKASYIETPDRKIELEGAGLELYKNEIESSINAVLEDVVFDEDRGRWETTYFADNPDITYTYGGKTREGKMWTPELSRIKRKVEELTGYKFNSAVVNYYEDGGKSITIHRDAEEELMIGTDSPVIASVSLGATRNFELIKTHPEAKPKARIPDKSQGDASIPLAHGDLLLMHGDTQKNYAHQIRKDANVKKPRLNITFRRTGDAELQMQEPKKKVSIFDNNETLKKQGFKLTNDQRKTLEHVLELVGPQGRKEIEKHREDYDKEFTRKFALKGTQNVVRRGIDPDKVQEYMRNWEKPRLKKLGNKKILAGYAGTGKTTIIENIIRYAADYNLSMAVWAPTHKAKLNILDRLPRQVHNLAGFGTIHHGLYGEPDIHGNWKVDPDNPPAGLGSIILIDESSMVSDKMYNDIQKYAIDNGAKVIFLGDGFQLPPVGNSRGNRDFTVFSKSDYEMTEVLRQALENPTLALATAIRINAKKMKSTRIAFIPETSIEKSAGKFEILNQFDFSEAIQRSIQSDENSAVIAPTNVKRIQYNYLARAAKYMMSIDEARHPSNVIKKGEILIGLNNTKAPEGFDDVKARVNSEIFKVPDNIKVKQIKNVQTRYTVWDNNLQKNVTKILDFDKVGGLYHIVDMDEGHIDILLAPSVELSTLPSQQFVGETLPSDMRLWNKKMQRYELKRTIAAATYGYAMTAHKAQGSQWAKVFIDSSWIPTNFEAGRWLYTALTRTETDMVIIDSGPSVKSWEEINNIANDKKYSLSKYGFIQPAAEQAKTRKYTKMLFDKFEGKIPYQFVNDPGLTNSQGVPVGAFYGPISKEMADKYNIKETKNSSVLINLAIATSEAPFHEYMHAFLIEMRDTNPRLFNNLLKEVLNTKQGKSLILDIVDAYIINGNTELSKFNDELGFMLSKIDGDIQSLSGDELYKLLQKYDDANFTVSDELLAFASSKEAVKLVPTQSKWRNILKKILNWMRYKIFGPNWTTNIYARVLDENTSLRDIARLLANSDKKFSVERYDRKLYSESFEFKINNRFKFMLFAKKESEKIADKDEDAAWIKVFFDGLWDKAHYNKEVKADKEEYSAIMNSILPINARPHFSKWYRIKFRRPMPAATPGFSHSGPIRDIGKTYIESNQDMLDETLGRVGADERELAPASILYIKEFGIPITQRQLARIARLAHQFDTYEEWRAQLFKEVLKNQSLDMLTWQEDGLVKYYSRIKSTAQTNRGDIGQDEITNYELLIQKNGDFSFSRKGPERKFRAEGEKKGTPGFQKKTLFDYLPESAGLFSWLSGSDIRMIGKDSEGKSQVENIYNFLDEEQLLNLDKHLIKKHNMTIAFSRGDSDKLALVPIKDFDKDGNPPLKSADMTLENIGKFLQREISDGYMTKAQAIEYLNEMKDEKDLKVRAANIAVHKAMKKVWPKYLKDIKGGPNVYKRLKIPFTPVTVNDKMTKSRVIKFNPKEVNFQFRGGKIFSPWQKVDGKKYEYMGDGETITSTKRFIIYNKFHGLKVGTAVAKTVHYLKDGDDVYAKKHQHFRADPGLSILDKKGRNLFKVSDNGNIYLGSAHPLYVEGGDNYVDELSTSDEIKIGAEEGGLFERNNNELLVPGSAIGFIKYEETMESHARHPMQWYNHLTAPKLLKHFREHYLPKLGSEMSNAIRKAIDGKDISAADKMAKLVETLENKNEDFGRVPTLLELLRLGSGFHRQSSGTMDKLIQSKLIEPALQLAKMKGSSYNIAMDVRGILKQGEIGLSRQKASAVIEAYKKAENITSVAGVNNDKINEWLKTNDVYAMVTRFPVPHEGGAYMAKVKYLHNRQGVITMEINDIKNRVEGDNDGDHVVVEFLPSDEMTQDYIKHLDSIKITPQELNDYVDVDSKDSMLSSAKRMALVSKLTAGQRAIGEIANIQAAYGAINKIYNSLGEFQVRLPNEQIEVKGLNPDGSIWKGTVSDYLRLWLQAAVDNAKFGLIGQFNYSQDIIISNLFKTKDGKPLDLNEEWQQYEMESIMKVIRLHIDANRIRNGRTFDIGNFSFRDTLNMSNDYYSYAMNRAGYIYENFGMPVDIKDKSLMPIEMVAIAPAKAMAEMHTKYPNKMDGFDVSPFIIEKFMHKNAHIAAMKKMDLDKDSLLLKAQIADNKTAKDLDYTLSEIQKGVDYANELGQEFKRIRGEFEELGAESLDYNEDFLKWKEKFHYKFKDLSNVAKLSATYKFLEGYEDTAGNPIDKQAQYIPAISDKRNQITMLDAKIMKSYFKTFNKEIQNNRDLQSDKNFKIPAYTGLDLIAKGLCE